MPTNVPQRLFQRPTQPLHLNCQIVHKAGIHLVAHVAEGIVQDSSARHAIVAHKLHASFLPFSSKKTQG